MTLKLEIPHDVEAGLLAAAHANGVSPEAYAAQLLREQLRGLPATRPTSGKRAPGRKSLVQLIAESPLKGLELKIDRDRDAGRPVEL
jgi:hypothetical protein